ncbi:hypothetical protein M231_05100 [Tremella mesenterica]|uniref:Uncharacterized protein n=1 Tax=Tremella mesenterica TaxID=5217 RepID=A0A4Q1BIX2_TREME|nr:hypothetical protein M231_05100 [Tremella mesenterica]
MARTIAQELLGISQTIEEDIQEEVHWERARGMVDLMLAYSSALTTERLPKVIEQAKSVGMNLSTFRNTISRMKSDLENLVRVNRSDATKYARVARSFGYSSTGVPYTTFLKTLANTPNVPVGTNFRSARVTRAHLWSLLHLLSQGDETFLQELYDEGLTFPLEINPQAEPSMSDPSCSQPNVIMADRAVSHTSTTLPSLHELLGPTKAHENLHNLTWNEVTKVEARKMVEFVDKEVNHQSSVKGVKPYRKELSAELGWSEVTISARVKKMSEEIDKEKPSISQEEALDWVKVFQSFGSVHPRRDKQNISKIFRRAQSLLSASCTMVDYKRMIYSAMLWVHESHPDVLSQLPTAPISSSPLARRKSGAQRKEKTTTTTTSGKGKKKATTHSGSNGSDHSLPGGTMPRGAEKQGSGSDNASSEEPDIQDNSASEEDSDQDRPYRSSSGEESSSSDDVNLRRLERYIRDPESDNDMGEVVSDREDVVQGLNQEGPTSETHESSEAESSGAASPSPTRSEELLNLPEILERNKVWGSQFEGLSGSPIDRS